MSPFICLCVPVIKGGFVTLAVARLKIEKIDIVIVVTHKAIILKKKTRRKSDLLPFKTAFLSYIFQCFGSQLT